MIDRKQVPVLQEIKEVRLTEPVREQLDNQLPVYLLDVSEQELVKIEFVFSAGRWYEPKKTIALATGKMLKEGTESHSARQLADKIEFYGATLETEAAADVASVVLYSLNKHLPHLLPLVKEILTMANFPEKELKTFVKNNKQKILVEKQKVEYLAGKKFHAVLFGEEHPYGYTSSPMDYGRLSRNDLIRFYRNHYTSDNCRVIISGKLASSTMNLLNAYFGRDDWKSGKKRKEIHYPVDPMKRHHYFVHKKDAVQSAIRIGRPLFNKTHPDYPGIFVLNTILGGYFGSRLMANIREDKGYTYGIYSRLGSLLYGGYQFIGTEVGREVTQKAIKEIYFEMERLREELIMPEELRLVKNYLLGTLLSRIDGPFNLSETIKGLILYNLDTSHFYQLVETIKTITSQRLMELANQYLDEKSMYEVVVGNVE